MPLPKIKENIGDLNKDIRSYINAKYDYLELRMLKKASKISIGVFKLFIICFLAVIVVTLLSFSASFWIGEKVHSYGGGFLIVAGFYLLVILIILLFGKMLFGPGIIRRLSQEFVEVRKFITEILKG